MIVNCKWAEQLYKYILYNVSFSAVPYARYTMITIVSTSHVMYINCTTRLNVDYLFMHLMV